MPNVTVTQPSSIKVTLGPGRPAQTTAIQYGGKYALKDATDLASTGAVDGDVIVYKADTNSFIIEPIENIQPLNLDNGFF